MHKICVATTLLFAAILTGCGGDGPPPIEETFRNPPELKSSGGELRTTFNVAATRFSIGGQMVTSAVYNGSTSRRCCGCGPATRCYSNSTTAVRRAHQRALPRSERVAAHQPRRDRLGQHLRARRAGHAAQLPSRHSRQRTTPACTGTTPQHGIAAAPGDGRAVGRPGHRGRARPVPRAGRHPRAHHAAQGHPDHAAAARCPTTSTERAHASARSTARSTRR